MRAGDDELPLITVRGHRIDEQWPSGLGCDEAEHQVSGLAHLHADAPSCGVPPRADGTRGQPATSSSSACRTRLLARRSISRPPAVLFGGGRRRARHVDAKRVARRRPERVRRAAPGVVGIPPDAAYRLRGCNWGPCGLHRTVPPATLPQSAARHGGGPKALCGLLHRKARTPHRVSHPPVAGPRSCALQTPAWWPVRSSPATARRTSVRTSPRRGEARR